MTSLALPLFAFVGGAVTAFLATAVFMGKKVTELEVKANLAKAAFQEQVVRHGYIDGMPRVVTLRLVNPTETNTEEGMKN